MKNRTYRIYYVDGTTSDVEDEPMEWWEDLEDDDSVIRVEETTIDELNPTGIYRTPLHAVRAFLERVEQEQARRSIIGNPPYKK